MPSYGPHGRFPLWIRFALASIARGLATGLILISTTRRHRPRSTIAPGVREQDFGHVHKAADRNPVRDPAERAPRIPPLPPICQV